MKGPLGPQFDLAYVGRLVAAVELEVEPGEFVAVTGPSGCGKSTLLNIVAGLEVADEGAVSIASDEITGRSETELALLRRKHVGMFSSSTTCSTSCR